MGLRSYLDRFQSQRRVGGRSLGQGTPLQDAKVQRVERIRYGLESPGEQANAALEQAKAEDQAAQQEFQSFEEIESYLSNSEQQLAQAENDLRIFEAQVHATPITADNADAIESAYAQVALNNRKLIEGRNAIAASRVELEKQKAAPTEPAMSWWQKLLTSGPAKVILGVLDFPGRVGATTFYEIANAIGGAFDTPEEAAKRQALDDLRAESGARAMAESGLPSWLKPAAGLYAYGGATQESFMRAGGELAQRAGLTGGILGELTANAANAIWDGDMQARDVDRFMAELWVALGADPTSYMGAGIGAKALQGTGKAGGLISRGVSKLVPRVGKPLEAVAGAVERTGAKALLLDLAPQTRRALTTMAKERAALTLPELAEFAPRIARGEAVMDKVMKAGNFDADTFSTVMKRYDDAFKAEEAALGSLAMKDRKAYRKLIEEASTRMPEFSKNVWTPALKAVDLAESAGAKSPVVAERLGDQLQLAQRVEAWRPVFLAARAVGAKFPKVAKAASWAREAFYGRIPLTGPYARAWVAGKMSADSMNSEMVAVAVRTQKELERLINSVPGAVQDDVRKAAIHTIEHGAPPADTHVGQWGQQIQRYAEVFNGGAEFLRAMELRAGVRSAKLRDVINGTLEGWYGRGFSDDMRRWLADNPQAVDYLDSASFANWADDWQLRPGKERKLVGKDFDEAEKQIREHMKVPDHIAVFDPNPEKVVQKRFAFAANNIERARQFDAFAREFGRAGGKARAPVVQVAVERFDRAMTRLGKPTRTAEENKALAKLLNFDEFGLKLSAKKLPKTVADMRPEQMAAFILDVMKREAPVPQGFRTMLDLALEAHVALPSTLNEQLKWADTLIATQDVEKWVKLAPGFRPDVSPKSLMGQALKFLDTVSAGIRRSILSSPASVGKDALSTMTWLAVATKNPITMAKHLVDYARGKGNIEALARLEAAGALRSTRAQVENVTAMGRFGKAVQERGVLGGMAKAIPFKGEAISKAVSAVPNKLLEFRESVDKAARYALFMDRKAAGFSDADAVEDVFKYLGNFNDYASGAIEKSVLQRFFLFWAWNRRALGFAMRGFMEHPLRAKMLFLMTAGDVSAHDEDMDRWALSRGGFIWGHDKFGTPKLIPLGAGSYMNPAWNALNSDSIASLSRGDVGAALGGASADAAAMSNPVVGGLMELAANKDSLTGLPIYRDANTTYDGAMADHAPAVLNYIPGVREFLGVEPVLLGGEGEDRDRVAYYRMNAWGKWFLEWTNPGGMNLAQQMSGLFDERRTAGEAALRMMAGIPTYSITALRADKEDRVKLNKLRAALGEAVADADGRPLVMGGDGRLRPNEKSEAGQRLQAMWLDKTPAERREFLRYDPKLLGMYDLGERMGVAWRRLNEEVPKGKTKLATVRATGLASRVEDVVARNRALGIKLNPDSVEAQLAAMERQERKTRRAELPPDVFEETEDQRELADYLERRRARRAMFGSN